MGPDRRRRAPLSPTTSIADPSRPPTLVVLHGHDDAPLATLDLGPAAVDRGWRVVAPAGPVDTGGGRRAWWRADEDGTPVGPDVATAVTVVDVAIRVAAGQGPVVLGGFSQGGALALALATRAGLPAQLAGSLVGVFAVGSWLPDLPGLAPDLAGAADRGVPVLIGHGADDDAVDPVAGRSAARALDRAGVPVTWVELEVGHRLDPFLPALADWVAALQRGDRPTAPP